MTTYAVGSSPRTAARRPALVRTHALWLGGGLALAFLVPYVLADRLGMPRDAYYAVYAAFAFGLFAAWARSTGQPPGAMLRRRWAVAAVLGLLFAGVMAAIVLKSDAGTRPEGLELVGALLWRGVVYGAADGLLLSAFPILVVFAAFAAETFRGKLLAGLAALAASVAMTAVYHAGYADFRSEQLAKPVAGDVAWSIPTLVTLNPVGAPIAHVGLHVTAVLHDSDTDLYLPPHR